MLFRSNDTATTEIYTTRNTLSLHDALPILPAFIIALAKWKTFGQFALIAGGLMTIHVLALNLVAPQLVGRRVRLNAVAITISLLFWGWVWGGMGLILAIPITAALRVICDHTESWRPIGRWLSA